MEPQEFQSIRALSSTHWWYQSLADIAVSVAATYPAETRILDAGCGTAYLAERLHDRRIYGVDSSPAARRIWQMDGLNTTASGTLEALPFSDSAFELTFCLDVIYHREVLSDVGALREVYRVLKPGGSLVLHTAAFESLRNRHDTVVHTARRYRRSRVLQILKQAGFGVSVLSYRNLAILPFVAASKLHASTGSNLRTTPTGVNAFMRAVSRLEWSAIRSNVYVPFGSSLLAIAHKPSG